ncbi:MAG: HDOD domain-containing protein [Betaproteobacteria bacterium]
MTTDTMNQDSAPDVSVDKKGQELNAQRFKMLEDIARELSGNVVFPTHFDAAFRLRRELQNPDVPIARVAKIVSLEPLIATRLMNLAGSALYSPDGKPARDLHSAITRLGLEVVRTTSLAIAMNQLMRSKEMAVFSDFAHVLWDHSLKTAAATFTLARKYTRIRPEEAMLAGLVHDLGAFYMIYRAAQYPELRVRPDSVKFLILQWHESIGVTLLSSLGISEEIINATVDHDQPREIPEVVRTIDDIVYVGNLLAGSHSAWSAENSESNDNLMAQANRIYAEDLPQIESDTKDMQSVFS